MTSREVVLVTGASGFIGSELVRQLVSKGFVVKAVVRPGQPIPVGAKAVFLDDLRNASACFWEEHLVGVDAVIHAAAIADQAHLDAETAEKLYESVNVTPTVTLASSAAAAGVTRFVFISSIKVLGESTLPGRPFRHDDAPAPQDIYGRSKLRAEQGLADIVAGSEMETVIVRPPLCYGPGVKGNFRLLARLADSGAPLPFASIDNRRSMLSLANLCDFLVRCISHPNAANETFLVSDGEDLSTSCLLRKMREVVGRPPRIIPFPTQGLYALGSLVRRGSVVRRLCESLQVDIEYSRELLEWNPPFSVDQGLQFFFDNTIQ